MLSESLSLMKEQMSMIQSQVDMLKNKKPEEVESKVNKK